MSVVATYDGPQTVMIRGQPYDVSLDIRRELRNGVDNYYTLTGPDGREIKANVRMTPNSMMISSSSVDPNVDPRLIRRFHRVWDEMRSFMAHFNPWYPQYDYSD